METDQNYIKKDDPQENNTNASSDINAEFADEMEEKISEISDILKSAKNNISTEKKDVRSLGGFGSENETGGLEAKKDNVLEDDIWDDYAKEIMVDADENQFESTQNKSFIAKKKREKLLMEVAESVAETHLEKIRKQRDVDEKSIQR
jgi:hypothetical protein